MCILQHIKMRKGDLGTHMNCENETHAKNVFYLTFHKINTTQYVCYHKICCKYIPCCVILDAGIWNKY